MGTLLVLSAFVIHFIMPGINRSRLINISYFDVAEVPQPPGDGDKPGMCTALQKPGILVALFKVIATDLSLIKVSDLGEHRSLQRGIHPDHLGAPPRHLGPPSHLSSGEQVLSCLPPYIEWHVSDWSILHGDGRIIWSEPSPVGLSLRSQGCPVFLLHNITL